MRILLFGPSRLAGFLRGAGHEVFELHANDLAVQAAEEFVPEAVLYFDQAEGAVVPHEDALKALVAGSYRVVLAAPGHSPLVPFAGVLGVRDFVFLPAAPEEILHRLENPATPQEAAEALRGLALDPAARAADGDGQGEGEPVGLFRRLAGGFGSRWRRTQREPPGEGEKAAPAAAAVRDAGGLPAVPEAVPAPVPVSDEAARDPLTGCFTRRCLGMLSLEPPCAERAGGAGVLEAVRQGFSFAACAVLALGLVSGCIWLADLAARLFGVHAPVLREAAKVVEGFWGLVLAGVRG